MSGSSLGKRVVKRRTVPGWLPKVGVPLGYAVWVVAMFIVAKSVVDLLRLMIFKLGIPLDALNPVVFATLYSVVVYALMLWAVIWVPKKVLKQKTTKKELGLIRLPSWMDIALGPVAFLPYILLSGALLLVSKAILPAIDVAQEQELGFGPHIFGSELAVAFLLLVVVAPIVEETLFRGYLYGKLRSRIGIIASMVLVSLCFAVLHGQVNVAIDVFALSIMLCVLREFTGNIWAGALLHMVKNGLAFYLLFINPSLLSTMGS